MKNAVFWDVAPCAATCSRWFHARRYIYPEDGGDKIFRNGATSEKMAFFSFILFHCNMDDYDDQFQVKQKRAWSSVEWVTV
jgi:hypothetical protein